MNWMDVHWLDGVNISLLGHLTGKLSIVSEWLELCCWQCTVPAQQQTLQGRNLGLELSHRLDVQDAAG